MSMKIDVIFWKSKPFQKKSLNLQKIKQKENCFNCRTLRHFVKDCHKPKKLSALNRKWTYAAVLKALTSEISAHEVMFWTVCYNDDCQIHHSDKSELRWFSQKLKTLWMITDLEKKFKKKCNSHKKISAQWESERRKLTDKDWEEYL